MSDVRQDDWYRMRFLQMTSRLLEWHQNAEWFKTSIEVDDALPLLQVNFLRLEYLHEENGCECAAQEDADKTSRWPGADTGLRAIPGAWPRRTCSLGCVTTTSSR